MAASVVLQPGAIASYDVWTLAAGPTKVAAADPGPNLAHDDLTSYLSTPTVDGRQSFTVLPASIPPLVGAISRVQVVARVMGTSGGQTARTRCRLGASELAGTDQAVPNGSWGLISDDFTRPGGGDWTAADLSTVAMVVEARTTNATDIDCTSLWINLYYTPSGQGIESFREVISRRLRLRRLAIGVLEITVPSLEFADIELGQLFCLSHPDLPGANLRGADVKAWQRWPIMKLSSTIDERVGQETMICRDMREVLCTFWDTGKSTKAPIVYADGIARLDAGNVRTWARASAAWVRTPADTIVQVGYDVDKLDKDGLLFESASTNEILQSAFKNGNFTGWTKSGDGVAGSAIAPDTSELLFDPASTNILQSAKFTAGTPPGADLALGGSVATASIVANTVCRFSAWHKDDPGRALYYKIRRNFDLTFWRDSDQTWQAAETWNPLPVSTVRARHGSKQMNVGANATTLNYTIGHQASVAFAGQVNHLYHAQIEKRKFTTSAIVTEGALVTRLADRLTIANPSNAPAWPPDRGTARFKVIPGWEPADVLGLNETIAYLQHDANNYDWLYFDGANVRWVYERKAAGIVYTAVKAASPVPGTTYTIAARWTSDLGEQGLPNRTLSIFADGVKGTDATAAALVVVTDATLEIGSKAGAEHFDGNIWMQEITQQALSDAQVARY